MSPRRIEWIGVRSPLQDDRIAYRKMAGLYSDKEDVLLEAVADLVAPLIRQPGSTARVVGIRQGLSKDYKWGPKRFILDMPDIDADRLFTFPDEYEWRDLENPEHDNRRPVVPWQYINKMLWRIMQEAANGPGLVLKGQRVAHGNREAEALLRQWQTDRIDEAKDRGFKVDPQTLRIHR